MVTKTSAVGDEAVVFERRRAPANARRLTFALGLATLGAVAAFVGVGDPVAVATTAALGGVAVMILGLMAADSAATGGRLRQLRRRLRRVLPRTSPGYRERPPEPELWVDDEAVPEAGAREVVVGHYASQDFDFFPVYLVLDDRVVELDVFRSREKALEAQAALATRLQLPTRELQTGIFGFGAARGCLVGALTIGAQVAAIGAGGVGSVFVNAPALQLLLPTLMVLALWSISELARRATVAQVRPLVDREVSATFGLGRARAARDGAGETLEGAESTERAPAD